jgi:hypothetical protein
VCSIHVGSAAISQYITLHLTKNVVATCSVHTIMRNKDTVIKSNKDKYLYFFNRNNKFVFAAVALDEVYYLPSRIGTHNARVLALRKAHEERDDKLDSQMREWHLRLGHVGKDRLIQILSEGIIDDAPKISKQRLTRVKFFCRTCAQAKLRRMSYRNMTGDKGPEPLNTLHLDSLGKIKIKGLYGTAGHMYALAIVDDATAYKWYFILKPSKSSGQNKIPHYPVGKVIAV